MKVTEPGKVIQIRSGAQSAGAARRPPEDKVSVSESAPLTAAIGAARANAEAVHQARLDALTQAIRSGSYQPSAQRLAERLLDAAELDARLRALLGGGR